VEAAELLTGLSLGHLAVISFDRLLIRGSSDGGNSALCRNSALWGLKAAWRTTRKRGEEGLTPRGRKRKFPHRDLRPFSKSGNRRAPGKWFEASKAPGKTGRSGFFPLYLVQTYYPRQKKQKTSPSPASPQKRSTRPTGVRVNRNRGKEGQEELRGLGVGRELTCCSSRKNGIGERPGTAGEFGGTRRR